MSGDVPIQLVSVKAHDGEWDRIQLELLKSLVPGEEDVTHRVSLLKSARTTLLSIAPGTSVRCAVTLMIENGLFSASRP